MLTSVRVTADRAIALVATARDRDLRLALARVHEPDGSPGNVPAYHFDMLVGEARAGTISLRVGDNDWLVRHAGQVGYAVDPAFRGHRLAGRATRLLVPLARVHGLHPLWITCNPDNAASIRTLERLGATLVERIVAPSEQGSDHIEERPKLRYRLEPGTGDTTSPLT